MNIDRGYRVGPCITKKGERPWPNGWEQDPRIDDGHPHEWETCLLGPPAHHRVEEVVRCRICHAPRCGHTGDHDPCMLRRHHRSPHMLLSGYTRYWIRDRDPMPPMLLPEALR